MIGSASRLIAVLVAVGALLAPRGAHAMAVSNGCGQAASSGINSAYGSGPLMDGRGNACNAGPALSLSTTSSSATTLTLTPAANEFVHIAAVTVDNCAGASAVTAAAPTFVTSTNLNGFTVMVGSGVTAGLCQPTSQLMLGDSPLRAAAAGAATVVTPTFKTNQTVTVSVYWYSAP